MNRPGQFERLTCRWWKRDHGNARTAWWCDGSTDLSKTRKRGAGRQLPRQSVCTVNWQRIGGLACNSTGKLSAFQTSLYAGRTHTSWTFLFSTGGHAVSLSRSVTLCALKASTSYPYFWHPYHNSYTTYHPVCAYRMWYTSCFWDDAASPTNAHMSTSAK